MKKIVSLIIILTITLLPYKYVYATTTISDSGDYTIPVTAEITPVFQVTLPNAIYITERQIKEFDITAKGTPKRSETLFINTPSKVNLTQGNDVIELDFVIDKNKFYYSDLEGEGTTTKCRIDGTSLLSGIWEGTLDIEIALKDFELPTDLTYDSLIIAYRNSQGMITIETMVYDLPYSYNQSTGYLGRYGGERYSKVYEEQSDGSYTMRQSLISTNKIKVSEIDLIYSNYDIPYSTSGIWFENTVFN